MNGAVPLSQGVGEVMAPQTLLTAFVVSPGATISLDPGALHGRSEVERSIRLAPRREDLADARRYWFVWVAIELDGSGGLLCYKGVAVSELWVDEAKRVGYKALAGQVNRIAEALRGGVNLNALDHAGVELVRRQLVAVGSDLWRRSAQPLKAALGETP